MMTAARTRTTGWLALIWGLLLAVDFGLTFWAVPQWLALFTAAQSDFFIGLPDWVFALWAASVASIVLGGLGLVWLERWAVGALLAALAGLIAFTLWLVRLAEPPMQTVTGDAGIWLMTAVTAVTALFYLLARFARVDAQLS